FEPALLDALVFHRLRVSLLQIGRKVERHPLGDVAWAWIILDELLPPSRGVSGLLAELALRGLQGLLPGVQPPRRQLPHGLLRGEPELPYEQDALLRIDRHHDGGPRMADYVTFYFEAAGLNGPIFGYGEDLTLVPLF